MTTILNPAPAAPLPTGMLALCDYVTPNESEAEALTGLPVTTVAEAEAAARALRAMGAGAAVITLGAQGALFHDGTQTVHVPAVNAGPVVETTGAGDAFNGGFAVALAEGADPVAAVRFGCATAGISVTRPGTAPSMPARAEYRHAPSLGGGRGAQRLPPEPLASEGRGPLRHLPLHGRAPATRRRRTAKTVAGQGSRGPIRLLLAPDAAQAILAAWQRRPRPRYALTPTCRT